MGLITTAWIVLHILGFSGLSANAGTFLPRRSYTFNVTRSSTPPVIHFLQNVYLQCEVDNQEAKTLPVIEGLTATFNAQKSYISFDIGSTKLDRLEFELELHCNDYSVEELDYYLPLLKSHVVINVLSLEASDVVKVTDAITPCALPGNLTYDVLENSDQGILDQMVGYGSPDDLAVLEMSSTNKDATSLFAIHSSNQLKLIGRLDREKSGGKKEMISFSITCTSSRGGQTLANVIYVTVRIYDTDDNLPKAPTNKVVPMYDVQSEMGISSSIFLRDKDSIHVTNDASYNVTKIDPLNAMEIVQMSFRKLGKMTMITTKVKLYCAKSFALPYQIQVIIEDVRYRSPSTSPVEDDNKIISLVTIDHDVSSPNSQEKVIDFPLDLAAAQYSLIGNANKDGLAMSKFDRWEFTEVFPRSYKNVFGITPEADIYLKNATQFRRSYAASVEINPTIQVVRYVNSREAQHLRLFISINNANSPALENKTCDHSCSNFHTEESCRASCGLGSLTGRCQWHQGRACVPNPSHCSDGICSALEHLDASICPQDCKQGPTGQSKLLRHEAPGPCWCASPNDTTCVRPDVTTVRPPALMNNRDSTTQTGIISNPPTPRTGTVIQNNNSQSKAVDEPTCSEKCRAGVVGALVMLLLVVIVVFFARRAWKRRQRAEPPALKHVGSSVSMGAIPSDYIMDDSREQRSHVVRQTPSPAPGQWISKMGLNQEVDDRWEFPREQLTVDDIIGEGEFGQVVSAEAKGMNGNSENTLVAIKMLKPDASGTEHQDLLSEFNMLKEVDHPNVIKLLGVCTQKGPLYVIVEYCELGSLRSFLRSSKFKNRGGWDEKQRILRNSITSLHECRNLTVRDFFSFAWQIAKGMEYLAGLKIVHRDLAARNVLVTQNLLVKISDFGLSRDIYEADAYRKMSKGRIPVKWMAPESLYAQIYTTKSDIWSYGIVLWEIATLGASPYPGIPPERLFPLLSTGYRMDRPEECPDEFYAIMQKCWKFAPEDRPSFCTLRNILDHLLQQKAAYLELSNDMIFAPELHSLDQTGSAKDGPDSSKAVHGYTNDRVNNIRYNNVCPNGQPAKQPYVLPHWQGDGESDSECPESSHLLSPSQQDGTFKDNLQNGADDIQQIKAGQRNQRLLVHENLTYS